MNTSCFLRLALLVMIGVGFTTEHAWAQARNYQNRRPSFQQRAQSRQNQPGTTGAPGAPGAPRAAAAGTMEQAQEQLRAAAQKLNQTETRLRNQMAAQPQWAKVLADWKTAQSEYDAATKPLMATVHTAPDYLQAYRAERDAEKELSDLNDKLDVSVDEVSRITDKIAKNNLQMKQIEQAAIEADPIASKAKLKLDDAKAKEKEFEEQFRASLKENQEYQAARQSLEDAQRQIQEARAQQRPQSTGAGRGGFRGTGGGRGGGRFGY